MSNIYIIISTITLYIKSNYNKMIPVDIDNFNVININEYLDNSIRIRTYFNKIPRELGNCHNLEYLNLSYNVIVDITALSNCTSLRYLFLRDNKIVDISALCNCYSLKMLVLDNNKIVDISALSNCYVLRSLYVDNNKIVDISALYNCYSLKSLNIKYNKIKGHNFDSNTFVEY